MSEKKISEMLFFKEGNIADRKLLRAEKIDTIVNAANPTLMGSDRGVDGAVHQAVYELSGKKYQFRDKICQELGTSEKRNLIRTRRGQAVITLGYELCEHVIHVVGAKYDGTPGKRENCSSSRIQTLESCYLQIVELLKQHPDIKRIAIPIIGAGEYQFPFELAVRIAITSTFNALVEWKRHDPELFEMAGIERVYFFVYDSCEKARKDCRKCAEKVYEEYRQSVLAEQRVVFQKSTKAHFRYIREIQRYDELRGYFSVAKSIRLLLMWFRVLFLPAMWMKDLFGGNDWKNRRRFVEIFTLVKVALPGLYCAVLSGLSGSGYEKCAEIVFSSLVIYAVCDTLSYLLTLIMMADIQRPSANVTRSLMMLFVNYLEVSLDMAFLYWVAYRDQISIQEAVLFGILGECQIQEFRAAADYVWLYADAGIRFFFISLVFGYLATHIRQRKFRS